MIKILLVDDHPVVRDGYRRLLESSADIQVIAEAGSGEEACDLYAKQGADIVVLDLNMPGIGGLETIRRLRARNPSVRILVFSMHDNKVMIERALTAGATGYLSKSSVAGQMMDAVHSVAEDRPHTYATVPDSTEADANIPSPLIQLSKREFQVFCKLAEGQPVTDIAELLYISPKTVGVHQTNIMHKLELRNTAELTRLAIRSNVVEP
ncbi:response regulator transcription factor [Amphritea sp. HPY]|uniref:response regulator transcription factor n=1 Tax=Amphritea sp. HPY TaxID=3421652 RepID=UPI003D7E593A